MNQIEMNRRQLTKMALGGMTTMVLSACGGGENGNDAATLSNETFQDKAQASNTLWRELFRDTQIDWDYVNWRDAQPNIGLNPQVDHTYDTKLRKDFLVARNLVSIQGNQITIYWRRGVIPYWRILFRHNDRRENDYLAWRKSQPSIGVNPATNHVYDTKLRIQYLKSIGVLQATSNNSADVSADLSALGNRELNKAIDRIASDAKLSVSEVPGTLIPPTTGDDGKPGVKNVGNSLTAIVSKSTGTLTNLHALGKLPVSTGKLKPGAITAAHTQHFANRVYGVLGESISLAVALENPDDWTQKIGLGSLSIGSEIVSGVGSLLDATATDASKVLGVAASQVADGLGGAANIVAGGFTLNAAINQFESAEETGDPRLYTFGALDLTTGSLLTLNGIGLVYVGASGASSGLAFTLTKISGAAAGALGAAVESVRLSIAIAEGVEAAKSDFGAWGYAGELINEGINLKVADMHLNHRMALMGIKAQQIERDYVSTGFGLGPEVVIHNNNAFDYLRSVYRANDSATGVIGEHLGGYIKSTGLGQPHAELDLNQLTRSPDVKQFAGAYVPSAVGERLANQKLAGFGPRAQKDFVSIRWHGIHERWKDAFQTRFDAGGAYVGNMENQRAGNVNLIFIDDQAIDLYKNIGVANYSPPKETGTLTALRAAQAFPLGTTFYDLTAIRQNPGTPPKDVNFAASYQDEYKKSLDNYLKANIKHFTEVRTKPRAAKVDSFGRVVKTSARLPSIVWLDTIQRATSLTLRHHNDIVRFAAPDGAQVTVVNESPTHPTSHPVIHLPGVDKGSAVVHYDTAQQLWTATSSAKRFSITAKGFAQQKSPFRFQGEAVSRQWDPVK